jgi:hypothetical protein
VECDTLKEGTASDFLNGFSRHTLGSEHFHQTPIGISLQGNRNSFIGGWDP